MCLCALKTQYMILRVKHNSLFSDSPLRQAMTFSQELYSDRLNGNVTGVLPIYSPHKSIDPLKDSSENDKHKQHGELQPNAICHFFSLLAGSKKKMRLKTAVAKTEKDSVFSYQHKAPLCLKPPAMLSNGELFLLDIAVISRWFPLEITAGCVFLMVRLHHRPSLLVHQQLLAMHPI